MGECHIRAFGKMELRGYDDTIIRLNTHKVEELLCFLLIHREQPHHREVLAGSFWGDSPTRLARTYLRQALWQLHRVLDGADGQRMPSVLQADHDWVRVNLGHLRFDVAAFEQHWHQVQVHNRSDPGLDATCAEALESAVQLYRGDLLEGCYSDWCLLARERLQNTYLMMLDMLMDYCEVRQCFELGVEYGLRIMNTDPARERSHRRMMRLQYLAGHRAAALRQYQRCVEILDRELGVGPTTQTMALCERIRAEAPIDDLAGWRQGPVSAPTGMASDLRACLRQLQEVLTDCQRAVKAARQVVVSTCDRLDEAAPTPPGDPRPTAALMIASAHVPEPQTPPAVSPR